MRHLVLNGVIVMLIVMISCGIQRIRITVMINVIVNIIVYIFRERIRRCD